MDVRLVQLLGSFITTTSDYTLARLELTMRVDGVSPPTIPRLTDASERTLRFEWDRAEDALGDAMTYIRTAERLGGATVRDPAFDQLRRTVGQLDRYARAIRWVRTVEDRGA